MTALAWTDDLRLHQPQMDQTHEEFVELLALARAAVEAGDLVNALSIFERLLEHTIEHFAREEGWMQAIGFEPDNAHAVQHREVLQVMRDVVRIARGQGSCAPLLMAINELGQWFPLHARMMDSDLALCMAKAGFKPSTGDARGAGDARLSRPAQAVRPEKV